MDSNGIPQKNVVTSEDERETRAEKQNRVNNKKRTAEDTLTKIPH